MKAAGLKAIDTVVESTATLIKSKNPSNQELVDLIAQRINGVICMSLSLPFSVLAKKWQPPRNTSSVHTTLNAPS